MHDISLIPSQAGPSGHAVVGPGGIAVSTPTGNALVGPGGVAISAPIATSQAGAGGIAIAGGHAVAISGKNPCFCKYVFNCYHPFYKSLLLQESVTLRDF